LAFLALAAPSAIEADRIKDDLHALLLERAIADPVTDCWLWHGAVDPRDGRPVIWAGPRRKTLSAARLSLWVYRGEELGFDLADPRRVRSCWRKRACVNPEHLSLWPEHRRQPAHDDKRRIRLTRRICTVH
jgi:hypothetical protein